MDAVDTTTPIPFQFVPTDTSPDESHGGPISVDEFLESDLETENSLHKEHSMSMSVATESIETESEATDSLAEEADKVSYNEVVQSDCDSINEGPISVDEFLDSDAETENSLNKEHVKSMSVATESVETESEATDSLAEEANRVSCIEIVHSDCKSISYDVNITYDANPIEACKLSDEVTPEAPDDDDSKTVCASGASKKHQRQWDRGKQRNELYERAERSKLGKWMITNSRGVRVFENSKSDSDDVASEAPDNGDSRAVNVNSLTDDVESEAPDGCDSRGVCVYGNSKSDDKITKIDASVYDNNDTDVSEANDNHDEDVSEANDDNDSIHRGHLETSIKGRYIEPEVEAQEWTYEDHSVAAKEHQRQLDREKRRNERYERAERRRLGKWMFFGVFLLLLEVAAATIAVMNYQELVECCGRSIFSENEAVGERWNKIFYLIGIIYIPVIILIEIPTLIIMQESLFLFNPMVGYLLAMHMMYASNVEKAYIIFGLEAVAMLGQSMILVQMNRSPESCFHSIVNYTLAGITVYMLVNLTQQGGFCIVNDRYQSIFSESTCNTACIDEDSCFQCTGIGNDSSLTQCFIQFPKSSFQI